MAKRTKQNTLDARWSKKEKDVMYSYPYGSQTVSDGHLLHNRFSQPQRWMNGQEDKNLLDELEARGYDITTLRFSICKKEDHPRWKKND